ncbi:hypothetical protein ABK040_007132 [Willaertia magna]
MQTNAVLDIFISVPCTLRELFEGCVKNQSFIRKTQISKDKVLNMIDSKLIVIEKGMKHGDRIVFKGEGEMNEQLLSGDLIFCIEQIVDNNFKRIGEYQEHLWTLKSISLKDALTLNEIKFNIKLFEKIIDIYIDNRNNVIEPNYIHIIKGEGMPIVGTDKRGDLLIAFDIKFPSQLSSTTISKINNILSEEKEEEKLSLNENSNNTSSIIWSKPLQFTRQFFKKH